MTNAKQECSGNVDTVVKVSGEFDHSKWHLNRLNGCLATSDCGKKAARYTGEGTNYRPIGACVEIGISTATL